MVDKPLTIAVSGAAGRMGRIYVPELLKQGRHVRVYDPQRQQLRSLYEGKGAEISTNNRDLVQDADVVLLFVPVPKTKDVLKEMSRYLGPNVILGSAASSKELVARQEIEYVKPEYYPGRRIVEFHPMHGDNVPPKGQNFLTVPVIDFPQNGATAESFVRDLFLPSGVRVRHVDSVSKHDEDMGEIQGGNHSIAIYRDTAWYRNKHDPDNNSVNTSPLDDGKSLHARRPLGLNLQVYVVTMRWNSHVKDYVSQFESLLSEIDDLRIEGRREELRRMFEDARENIGSDAIKDARESLAVAYGTSNLDASINSHVSDLAWGVLYARRGKRPTDFAELESPHYILGRTILCAVYGSDIRRLVDNAIDNPETRKQDLRFSQAVPMVNQIIESSGDEVLLQHLEKLKRFFDGKDGVKMKRDMGTVADHSNVLGRSLRARTDEYAKLRAAA